MALTNMKRKHAGDTHGDKFVKKSQKRPRSNYEPLSSINDQAAVQLENSEAELTSRLKQPVVADTPHSSADEALSLSFQKATKQNKVSGKASGSSSDRAAAVKPSTAATSKKIAQTQDGSNSKDPSLDEGNASSADPGNASMNAASKVASIAPSSPLSEEVRGGSEDGSESEKDDEEKVNEDSDATHSSAEEEDEFNLENGTASDADSAPSSESSVEQVPDAESDSDGEPHPDGRKKEPSKADNPNAFASSMAGILGYKLTRTQRANPILARSADAKEADETLLDMKLEKKARAEMKREKFKKGGTHGQGAGELVGDVDGSLEVEEVVANQQRERELRKMAQKGVIKMFNAFNSVREKAAEAQGFVGSRAKKEERATEMSKEGWLEYVGQGGKGKG